MASVSEERLCKTIDNEIEKNSTFQITLNNTKTQMSYILHVISQVIPGEYLIELYENRNADGKDTKLIIKNRIRITKPIFTRKRPAVSAILGVVILMGIAAVAGGVFFTSVSNLVDESYFDIDNITASSFGDNTNSIYLEIDISSSIISDLLIDGDLQTPISIMQDWDQSPIKDDEITVIPTTSGLRASYEGVVQLEKHVSPGDRILLEFKWNDGAKIIATEVR